MRVLMDIEVSKEKWQSFYLSNFFSSPFQSHSFYSFFNSIEGLSANVFACEKNNEIVALCVVTLQKEKGFKGYFSRRAIIYGGPLLSLNNLQAVDTLFEKIKAYYQRKAIYIEIRNYFDFSEYLKVFYRLEFHYLPWLNYQVPTLNLDEIRKNMSSSRLRQVKKAFKNGVIWKEASSIEEVKAFYSIISNLYQNKIKKPLLPESFFLEFYKQNIGKYLLVVYQNIIIGGIMCPVAPAKCIYEYYICGLDNEYKEQYPSVMATWAAMEYAHNNGIPMFDFMGAGNPNEDYGVREFKARFGGNEVNYGRFIYILNPILYNLGKFGLKFLQKIK
jgi:lipid II:glycine glycyltransferase (peptidoglycan interpeptide bridge formation enzyme)